MSHDHSHEHPKGEKNLRTAFFLNLFFCIIEIIGGIYVNSVAIVSDAIHDLGDSISLGTAWYLERKSKKLPTDDFSYGYRRFSILGALINGFILLVGSGFVIYESIKRIQNPVEPDAQGMIYLAILGIIINGWAVLKLEKGNSLNERVVALHLWEDVLGWVAVLIVAIILKFESIPVLDPLLSLGITIYILQGTFRRLYDTIYILMQGTPQNVDIAQLKEEILAIENIDSIKDFHLWTLDGENHVCTLKLKLKLSDSENSLATQNELHKILEPYEFQSITIEMQDSSQVSVE